MNKKSLTGYCSCLCYVKEEHWLTWVFLCLGSVAIYLPVVQQWFARGVLKRASGMLPAALKDFADYLAVVDSSLYRPL